MDNRQKSLDHDNHTGIAASDHYGITPGEIIPDHLPAKACDMGCELAVARDAKTRRRNMFRAYIRVYDANRRQHAIPVGWWCPGCHTFMDDVR